jgi:hypothetical protein
MRAKCIDLAVIRFSILVRKEDVGVWGDLAGSSFPV